jgi:hypothetical protein
MWVHSTHESSSDKGVPLLRGLVVFPLLALLLFVLLASFPFTQLLHLIIIIVALVFIEVVLGERCALVFAFIDRRGLSNVISLFIELR